MHIYPCITCKSKIEINRNFGNNFFFPFFFGIWHFGISSDSCHAQMLLESLTITSM